MWTITAGKAAGTAVHFVTSDQHIGHQNIIKYAERPFDDVNHMNTALMNNWNSVVSPDDTVLVLGDIALGPIEDSLNFWKQFNGLRILVPGNHDRVSQVYSETKRERFLPMYEDAGFVVIEETIRLQDESGREILASHYPYHGDSRDTERYQEIRPIDEGLPLIHGHTHSNLVLDTDTGQFHVGVDAHNYQVVPMERISRWLNTLNR